MTCFYIFKKRVILGCCFLKRIFENGHKTYYPMSLKFLLWKSRSGIGSYTMRGHKINGLHEVYSGNYFVSCIFHLRAKTQSKALGREWSKSWGNYHEEQIPNLDDSSNGSICSPSRTSDTHSCHELSTNNGSPSCHCTRNRTCKPRTHRFPASSWIWCSAIRAPGIWKWIDRRAIIVAPLGCRRTKSKSV